MHLLTHWYKGVWKAHGYSCPENGECYFILPTLIEFQRDCFDWFYFMLSLLSIHRWEIVRSASRPLPVMRTYGTTCGRIRTSASSARSATRSVRIPKHYALINARPTLHPRWTRNWPPMSYPDNREAKCFRVTFVEKLSWSWLRCSCIWRYTPGRNPLPATFATPLSESRVTSGFTCRDTRKRSITPARFANPCFLLSTNWTSTRLHMPQEPCVIIVANFLHLIWSWRNMRQRITWTWCVKIVEKRLNERICLRIICWSIQERGHIIVKCARKRSGHSGIPGSIWVRCIRRNGRSC